MTSHTEKRATEKNDGFEPKLRSLWCVTETGAGAKPANRGAVRAIFSVS